MAYGLWVMFLHLGKTYFQTLVSDSAIQNSVSLHHYCVAATMYSLMSDDNRDSTG